MFTKYYLRDKQQQASGIRERGTRAHIPGVPCRRDRSYSKKAAVSENKGQGVQQQAKLDYCCAGEFLVGGLSDAVRAAHACRPSQLCEMGRTW